MLLRIIIAVFLLLILIGGYTWMPGMPIAKEEEPLNAKERRIISYVTCMNALLREMRAEDAHRNCGSP